MCLAVPLKIENLLEDDKALVKQANSLLEIDVSLLDEPKSGDFVIVHAGYAIEILDDGEAEERLELFRSLGVPNDGP